ncbi:MAG TPA: hypothetical protein VNJ09_01905 [Chthonomonadales bacterium]|nr:hypothetical protein [Chthonomonadales bacterium]
MNGGEKPVEQEPKRRKLDELFADEPFLSTTMKARRLHEKLRQYHHAELDAEHPLPTEAFVQDRPARSHAAGGYSGDRTIGVEEEAVSLSVAAGYLRARRAGISPEGERISAAIAERLQRFRDEVLSEWMKGLPKGERS